MIKRYPKGSDQKLSPHFFARDFDCHCQRCTDTPIDELLPVLLEHIQARAQTPLIILSGYRCEAHNKEVGGEDHSYHPRGMAADITAATQIPRLHEICDATNFNGGVGQYHTFVHVDVRGIRARWDLSVKPVSAP